MFYFGNQPTINYDSTHYTHYKSHQNGQRDNTNTPIQTTLLHNQMNTIPVTTGTGLNQIP